MLFFVRLTENVFNQSYQHWKTTLALVGRYEVPLLFGERNIYSHFASAINNITPIHLSEWSFNQSETGNNSRRVDFWCFNNEGEKSIKLNYFIEIKKTYYCVSEDTSENFTQAATASVNDIVQQIRELKEIKQNWDGNDERAIRKNIYELLDKRSKAQLIISTWTLPENIESHWEKDRVKFISLAGIAMSKASTLRAD